MSISWLIPELRQLWFIKDWPEIPKSETSLSAFCPTSGNWGELRIRFVLSYINTGLYKSAFSTDSFKKLVFCPSSLFASCQIRCNLHKLYNIRMIIIYIVGVRYTVFLFLLFSKKEISRQKYLNTNTFKDSF